MLTAPGRAYRIAGITDVTAPADIIGVSFQIEIISDISDFSNFLINIDYLSSLK